MVNKNYKLSKRKKLQIFPLGDIHIGSKNFNEEFFNHWIDTFKGSKSEKIIYLQGDLIDLARKSLGNSAYEQTMNVGDQIDYIVNALKPFKKHIAGSVSGNHCERSLKEFDLDVAKIIADMLETEYGYSLYHKYTINGKDYKIHTQHGNKVSAQPHLMLGAVNRATQHIDGDLFLYGHAHQGNSLSLTNIDLDGYKRRHLVLTGSFLDYEGSYAHLGGLTPIPACFPIISVGCNGQTDVKFINSDEVL